MTRFITRRLLLSAAFGVFALTAVAGCAQKEGGDSSGGATTPAAQTSADGGGAGGAFKASLITVGPITDKGWSQTAYTGLQKIKDETGAEIGQPVENPGLAQVEGVMRTMAQDGAKLILANGSEFDDAAKKIAPDVPGTTICIINGRSVGPNLMPIQFKANQVTYLAGMIAAGMSKTGKIGCVGPVEIPIIKDSFAAFEKGVKAVNPAATVTVTFVGSEDIAKAKQQAQALLDAGTDVILGNANNGNNGVAQAVMEKDGAYFIGANSDQSDLATDKNIGSFIIDVPSAMVGVAKNVKDGQNAGKAYTADVGQKDVVYFKYNPGFKGTVPDDLKKKVEAATADMLSGKLSI